MKKFIALILTAVLLLSLVACAGDGQTTGTTGNPNNSSDAGTTTDPVESKGGTLMFLSNISSGPQYDFNIAYLEMATQQLGYKLSVVYGDPFNDPSGNLEAVKNGMTHDVVGLISAQDGGILNIMQEFPDLFVVGFANDMASVYSEGGASAAARDLDHFLGAIADGYVSGVGTARNMFDILLEKGYKKITSVTFPAFAYPQLVIADATFRQLIDEHNAGAAAGEKIELVGETEILMFEMISDAYFMEPEHQDLDAIVGFCAGVLFIYPAMKNAIDAGTISADTKLLTGGFDTDPNIVADIGDDGIIQGITMSAPESLIYALILLDNAIQGNQFPDFAADVIDAPPFTIKSTEDINKVMNQTGLPGADMSKLQLPWDQAKVYFRRYNADATYADLMAMLASDKLTVEGIGQ